MKKAVEWSVNIMTACPITPPGHHYTYFRTDCPTVIYGTEGKSKGHPPTGLDRPKGFRVG